MRNTGALFQGLLAAFTSGSALAANVLLSYRGRPLMPITGNGVPDAKILRFKASGHLPEAGKCRTDFTILNVSDGKVSLKTALAAGYMPSPDNFLRICRDAQSGALSERLRVNVTLNTNGVVIASRTWLSSDPRRGRAADTVISFENIEYHVSEAKRVGRLAIDPGR